jgi:hypothetical protein
LPIDFTGTFCEISRELDLESKQLNAEEALEVVEPSEKVPPLSVHLVGGFGVTGAPPS